MKKHLLIAAAVLLSASSTFCLSGCNSSSSNADEDTATETSAKRANDDSPMGKMFASTDNVKAEIIGKNFASADNSCLIDCRRENRVKVFVKENGNWTQYDGKNYNATYDKNDAVCVEFTSLEPNGGGKHADGVLTPSSFELSVNGSNQQIFKDMRIVTKSEAEQIYEGE